MAAKIKKNDTVVVLTGKDKGKTGKVLRVMPSDDRIVVEGVNQIVRHVKPSMANPNGGRVTGDGTIHVSNVAIADPKDGSPTRVGFKVVDGKKVRFAKKSGEAIDG